MEPCNLTEGPHVLAANSITLVKPVISDYPLRDDRHTNCTMNIRFVFIEMILSIRSEELWCRFGRAYESL